MIKKYILCWFCLGSVLIVSANDDIKAFEMAYQAYQTGDFQAALSGYEQLATKGLHSKELHYNIGNCYFRLNQIGRARLNYERALRFDAADADVLHNISILTTRLKDDIPSVDDTPLVRNYRQLRGVFSTDAWAVFALLFLWLGIGGFGIWLFGKQRMWKKRGFISGFALIPVSLMLFAISKNSAAAIENMHPAIILKLETSLHPIPNKQSNSIMSLHEGLKVYILDKTGDFFQVRLPNGETGWLEANVLEAV